MLERAFRPDTVEDARARSLQAHPTSFSLSDVDPKQEDEGDPPPTLLRKKTECEPILPSEPIASASHVFPAHPTYTEQVRRVAYPMRGEPPLSSFRGEPFARPPAELPEQAAAGQLASNKDSSRQQRASSAHIPRTRGHEPGKPDPNGDPSNNDSNSCSRDMEPRQGRLRGRRPNGRRRQGVPSPSPSPPLSPPRGGGPAADPNCDPSDALLAALKVLFPDGLPKSSSESHELCMNMKYDRTSMPKWDGKSTSLVHSLHEMNYLASLNPCMSHDLAVLVPQRFTGFA